MKTDLYNITAPMIGIITSWTENFNCIKLCQKFDIPFCIIADTEMRPYQEKTENFIQQRVNTLLNKSKEIGCTHIILSPIQELYRRQDKIDTYWQTIIPIFSSYLEYCLQHSLVGKIGFIGGHNDISQIEAFFTIMIKSYQLTDKQKTTKKFDLSKWTKDVSMREYFSRLYSSRNLLINKTIKEDLKYFKDANVDTLIPLNYSYFNYQRTITSYLNPKKYKFHKRSIMEEIFKDLIEKEKLIKQNLQVVTIYHTWSVHIINSKKWRSLYSQWEKKDIESKLITL